ncbi:TraR/DksA family transcriptional regulator [Actinoplanes sp. NPDC024001]|uniref:TraR/DksA family transcriptional regulator n=1 Tax=Actinoplanes sp. NPDC024001 TaxID=3154598 RepID=UPI0033D39E71
MPVATSHALTVTAVTAACAALRPTASPSATATYGLPSPAPTGRSPPADPLSRSTARAKLISFGPFLLSESLRTGRTMSVETDKPDQGRLTAVRTSLSEQFALQTARLKELTEINDDTGDPAQAHDRAALLAATRQSLEQITSALNRIADGSYGRCERCTTAIPAERLEALPHARLCVPCQQKHQG